MLARLSVAVRAFAVWLISVALLLAILGLGYQVVMVVAARSLGWDRYDARFSHLLYYIVAGGVCLFYLFMASGYFNAMAQKGHLLQATLKTIGSQLAIVAAMQLILTLYGYFPLDWLNVSLLAGSGALGLGMLFFARRERVSGVGSR
ncbi:MAG: hypothetical protein ACOYYS_24770 [Chloroflexota bacterium]